MSNARTYMLLGSAGLLGYVFLTSAQDARAAQPGSELDRQRQRQQALRAIALVGGSGLLLGALLSSGK